MLKTCSKCGIEKELSQFHFKNKTKGTYRGECKLCQHKRQDKYRKTNQKKISDRNKQYYKNNVEKFSEKNRYYYEANTEKINESSKKRYQNNAERIRERQRQYFQTENGKRAIENGYLKRRSYKNKVHFTPLDRSKLLDRDNWECQCCGIKVHDRRTGDWNTYDKAHIDHVVPISHGGNSEPSNLQVLCRTCNLSKSNKIVS
jgi:5-methylcytosine-specific restriction endonuclease McrA